MEGNVDATAFSRELASLKRDGCTVLVVSDAAGRDAACERLLGAPELDRRHVFLSTARDVNTVLDRHQPRRADPSSFGVVDATPGSSPRSAAAAAQSVPQSNADTPSIGGDEWYARVDDLTDFEALSTATRDALERVSEAADAPGELRFCLDSLDPLFDNARDEESEQRLFRFLHLVTSSVRAVDGMGHVHVSGDIDDRRRRTFEPLFDATIEVQTDETGTVRQRWRLHDSGHVSDWFEL